MIPERYIPEKDERVKLSLFDAYTRYGIDVWAWLKVLWVDGATKTELGTLFIDPEKQTMKTHVPTVCVEVLNGDKPTGITKHVKLSEIEAPIYWEKVYVIYVRTEAQGENVAEWLKSGRGVRCMGSLDLSCAGERAFVPGDRDKPHWKYNSGEVVYDPDRIKILLIVKHPVPTGNPEGGFTAAEWKKEKKKAARIRQKAMREHKALGREIHNIKDGNCILESWFETYKELPKPKVEEIELCAS